MINKILKNKLVRGELIIQIWSEHYYVGAHRILREIARETWQFKYIGADAPTEAK